MRLPWTGTGHTPARSVKRGVGAGLSNFVSQTTPRKAGQPKCLRLVSEGGGGRGRGGGSRIQGLRDHQWPHNLLPLPNLIASLRNALTDPEGGGSEEEGGGGLLLTVVRFEHKPAPDPRDVPARPQDLRPSGSAERDVNMWGPAPRGGGRGAFSHSAGAAPMITLLIPGTPLKTTHVQKDA